MITRRDSLKLGIAGLVGPMVDPLAAGRWFMRGRDGRLRCYDLRRPA